VLPPNKSFRNGGGTWQAMAPILGPVACFANEELRRLRWQRKPSWLGRAHRDRSSRLLGYTRPCPRLLEMQGRRSREASVCWKKHERYFAGGNNMIHHIWWHRAMFHLEQREFDAVSRPLRSAVSATLISPLTQALPDLYIDVQNACIDAVSTETSRQWDVRRFAGSRIAGQGPNTGSVDCISAFHPTSLDDGAGRRPRRDDVGPARMLDAMRRLGLGDGAVAQVVGNYSFCLCLRLCWRIGEVNTPVAVDLNETSTRRNAQSRRQSCSTGFFGAGPFLDSAIIKANRGDDVSP